MLICTAGTTELKDHMQKYKSQPSHQQLADFHLLLYLSKLPSFNLEVPAPPPLVPIAVQDCSQC